jgi:hypothetical protein
MGNSQPPGRPEFVARVGTFFVLVGIGMMVFFLLSDAASDPRLSYFCWGTVLLSLGFMFQARFKRPAGPPSGRFGVLQRLKRKPKEEKKK